MILAGGHASAKQIAGLIAEAQAVAKLDHPNIVRVYDIAEHNGLPYFAMEYVEGGTLQDLVRKESLDPTVAARFLESVARGVHYAHTRKVIHRDLKPANVLISPDGYQRSPTSAWPSSSDEIGGTDSRGPASHGHAQLHAAGTGRRPHQRH